MKRLIQNFSFIFKMMYKLQPKKLYIFPLIILVDAIKPFVVILFPARIINQLAAKDSWESILITILLMCAANFTLNFFSHILFEFDIICQACFLFQFTGEILKKYMQIDLKDLESPDTYRKYYMANQALEQGTGFFMDIVKKCIVNAIQVIGTIAILLTLSPVVTGVILIIVLLNAFLQNRILKIAYELDKKLTSQNRKHSYYEKIMFNHEYGMEIRLYSLKNILLKRYAKNKNSIIKEKINANRKTSGLRFLVELSMYLQQGGVYIYLIIKCMGKGIQIGSFSMYIYALETFKTAANCISEGIIEINKLGLRIEDIRTFMEMKCDLRETATLSDSDCHFNDYSIEFRNVSFKYPTKDEYVLKNVSIKIPYGTKLAVIGNNGAGKSTFIKLLIRLYAPTDGGIYLGGVNIKDIPLDIYYRLIGIVFQDFRLFSFTIKDNIVFTDKVDSGDKRLNSILDRVGLSSRIKKTDFGLDTYVNRNFEDNGIKLSGGEGQKIAIARALYREGEIVIMDEPTSALDAIAEFKTYKQFNEMLHKKTGIYISHRMASTKFCDKIVVFKNGEICEYGTHDELIDKRREYYNMYLIQSQYYVSNNGKGELCEGC